MRRLVLILVGAVIAAAIPAVGVAQVSVGVTVPAPAVTVAVPPPLPAAEPEMVVVPSGNEYVYMVPNTYGVYFHNGYWFRYYNGGWFRSAVYNSGWVSVGIGVVPRPIIGVYPEYAMFLPVGYYRIGWGDFHHHWRDWGHRHHWHHQSWYKHEMRHDVRRDRMRHIDRERQKWSRGQGTKPPGYGVHKTPPSGKKVSPSGKQQVKPGSKQVKPGGKQVKTGGKQQVKPGSKQQVKPGGSKPAPGMAPKNPPRSGQGSGHSSTPPHK